MFWVAGQASCWAASREQLEQSGHLEWLERLEPSQGPVPGLALSGSGKVFVQAGEDGEAEGWDALHAVGRLAVGAADYHRGALSGLELA